MAEQATEQKAPSSRALGNAARLLIDPTSCVDICDKLEDSQLSNLGAVVRQIQSLRSIQRGDLDAIILDAFENGFGKDDLAHRPWIHDTLLICPGGLVYKSQVNHNCRFVSINDTWVWDAQELLREDKRPIAGKQEGFRAVALVAATEGLRVDYVTGKARTGQHSMVSAICYEIREGELVEVSQRKVRTDHA